MKWVRGDPLHCWIVATRFTLRRCANNWSVDVIGMTYYAPCGRVWASLMGVLSTVLYREPLENYRDICRAFLDVECYRDISIYQYLIYINNSEEDVNEEDLIWNYSESICRLYHISDVWQEERKSLKNNQLSARPKFVICYIKNCVV